MRRRRLLCLLAILAMLPTVIPRMASAQEDLIAKVTAKFWWWTPEVALASGFSTDGHCVDASVIGLPQLGAMGVHYVKQVHVDGTFNSLEPEAIMFDPRTNALVGVEYIVIARSKPWAFGQPFDPFPPIPGAWALHLWLAGNTSGRFSAWNPAIACAQDPAKQTVLIGEAKLADMRIKLELEPAKSSLMLMDGNWSEMKSRPEDKFHVEVKPEDPKSNTRIPYAQVRFLATNRDTGQTTDLDLHPMWGSSGLHYAANGDLPDGTYLATVTVGVPTFMRAGGDKERWMTPTQARFEFTLHQQLLVSAKVVVDAAEPMGGMPPASAGMTPGMQM